MRSQHAVQISLRARKRATGPAAAAHPDPRSTMSPSFDAEDASVVKVDVRDPQSAARVGKFMVVVPPKVRARPRSPRGARGVERRIPRGIPVVCSIHLAPPPP